MLYMVYHCSLHITSVPLTPLAHISVPAHDALLLALPSLTLIIKHVPDPIPLPCMRIACGSTPVKQKSPRSRVSSRILKPSQGDEPCVIYPASAPRWHITHIRLPSIMSRLFVCLRRQETMRIASVFYTPQLTSGPPHACLLSIPRRYAGLRPYRAINRPPLGHIVERCGRSYSLPASRRSAYGAVSTTQDSFTAVRFRALLYITILARIYL